MNISLTPELERLVNKKVASGMYQTASEVIRDALRLLKQREETRLAELRRDVEIGVGQIERGEYAEYREDKLGALARKIKAKGVRRIESRRRAGAR